MSNTLDFSLDFVQSNISNFILNIGESDNYKTLGIQWNTQNDLLTYYIKTCSPSNQITKRYMLASIAQIYDPLGLLSPVVILAKILIQRLWSIRIS